MNKTKSEISKRGIARLTYVRRFQSVSMLADQIIKAEKSKMGEDDDECGTHAKKKGMALGFIKSPEMASNKETRMNYSYCKQILGTRTILQFCKIKHQKTKD